jgi:hypothetical protein
MAGTMPHAIFIETGLDDGRTAAAYAAELPGCAVFAPTAEDAAAAMPARVHAFTGWLRAAGEEAPEFVGDNWYEVERAPAGDDGRRRATFSLDELPPSPGEWGAWQRWAELAREELADVIDAAGELTVHALSLLEAIVAADLAAAASLSGSVPAAAPDDAVDRLYTARDALTDALASAGPAADGVRRCLRLAIADDLRAADALRSGDASASAGEETGA